MHWGAGVMGSGREESRRFLGCPNGAARYGFTAVEMGVGAEYHAASSGHSSVRCEASWQSGESGIQGRHGGRRHVFLGVISIKMLSEAGGPDRITPRVNREDKSSVD